MGFLKINIDFLVSNNFQVNYKLHPAEFYSWKSDYPILREMVDSEVVNIVTTNPSLKEVLSISDIVIGISSTAIYEALDHNCRVIVLDLPSSVYFEDLIDTGVIQKLDWEYKLSSNDLDFYPKKSDLFFMPTELQVIYDIIN